MNVVKNIYSRLKEMPWKKKAQLSIAFILTVALLVSAPSFAWFSYKRRIVKLQKVEAPNVLVLSAAHREESMCFEINGINPNEIAKDVHLQDIKDSVGTDPETDETIYQDRKITYKDYVFCVTGTAVDKFTIQLAYTTNNPFTYAVYAADELTEAELTTQLTGVADGTPIDFVAYTIQDKPVKIQETELAEYISLSNDAGNDYHLDTDSDILCYRIDTSTNEGNSGLNNGQYTGTYLNSSDGLDANNDVKVVNGANVSTSGTDGNYYRWAYEQGDGVYQNSHHDARPVYWQATNVSAIPGETNSNRAPFSRHFILRVQWTADALDNTEKETDIVYLSVKATS